MLEAGFDPRTDVFNRLLKNRVIMLGAAVNDDIANQICAQLLYLEGEDPNRDIWLYINSPGGSVTAGMAIYDTMQFVGCDVATVCLGLAASMGQFLLTAGAAGKRYTLPNARIMMHQPLAGLRGQAADIAIQAEQLAYTKQRMAELIAQHSGKPLEQIQADSERDRWFTAEQAAGVRPLRQGDPAPRRDPLTPGRGWRQRPSHATEHRSPRRRVGGQLQARSLAAGIGRRRRAPDRASRHSEPQISKVVHHAETDRCACRRRGPWPRRDRGRLPGRDGARQGARRAQCRPPHRSSDEAVGVEVERNAWRDRLGDPDVGRTTGRRDETPVQAVATDDGFVIALPYGPNTDWLKNVLANRSATIVHEGNTYEVDQPEVLPMSVAAPRFAPKDQRTHRLFRVEQALLVRQVASRS